MPTARAPGAAATRTPTEDGPYDLAARSALAAEVGATAPTSDAIVILPSAVLGDDCRAKARTPANLPPAAPRPEAMVAFLHTWRG